MVSRSHNDVLKDIRRIIEQLGEGTFPQSYFIESTYKNSQNKELPCFLLTKKGCELYATRMTGEKGTLFAMTYIERFNEMEKELTNPVNSLELALQAALKHEQELKIIKSDVDYLKESMRIDGLQQQEIQQAAKQSIVHALGGKDSVAYQEISKKVFSAFWNEFKQYFKVPRYGDIPKVKYEEALRFINLWRPSTSLQIEIDSCNSQMAFG
ncbi:ORF6C domain-containing protein [Lysinibacillus sphaericus]|nr:hypothetical protein [Lysinibacillus sphaericus]QTB29439.1 ORF6C domain-containing protein [Lysinibacillus sphaericus]